MLSKKLAALVLASCFWICASRGALDAQAPQPFEDVIIQAARPFTNLLTQINALGGSVIHEYKHIDAVAVRIPSGSMEALGRLVGSATINKDERILAPAQRDVIGRTKGNSASPITDLKTTVTAAPAAYNLNNFGLNVAPMHEKGYTGAGVIVAVVDSGVRPGFPLLESDNSVIGGIDLVGDGLAYSDSRNDPHGTFVAGLISGNASVNIAGTPLEASVRQHFPGALVGSDLPLIGSAPAASIYAVRVFGTNAAAGAPESRLIAAIDHVIEMKLKYLEGDPTGLNIQVCNLSLGNTTLYAGRDLFDRSVDALLANGIVAVVSSGETGPAGLTISSPASSLSSIAVGSASPAANERVQADISHFPGYGIRYRPSSATQVAWFSGRGPTADGRVSPNVVAVGVGNFGQGFGANTEVQVLSGSSLSAPLVSGVAALLRQAHPAASAVQIRNAIIGSGNPTIVGPGFSVFDQGSGIPDAFAAFNNLANFPSVLPPVNPPSSTVATNVRKGTDLQISHSSVTQSTGNLFPGQRAEILYRIAPRTSQVVITVSNFTADPNVSPNNIFPEEIYLQVHSAKTSQIGAFGDYYDLGNPFITKGTFTINNPEPGLMRITLSGSWTNQSGVAATVAVDSSKDLAPGSTLDGLIVHHEQRTIPVIVPRGTAVANFKLSFANDWASYPTTDLDMTLFDPNRVPNTDGAHLNAPEHVTILDPLPGLWLIQINGFDIPTGSDNFDLRVELDGRVVR